MPTTYAIPDGRTVMAATLYTGNGTSVTVNNTVNGIGFQPDWVWVKKRTTSGNNTVTDSVRGNTKQMYTDSALGDQTDSTALQTFNSNGFTWGAETSGNASGVSLVGWQWKKGASSGFDIVSQTLATTGINTITHSLNAVPTMVLAKKTSAGAEQWLVYQSSGTTQSQYLGLNTAAGVATSGSLWGSSAFTSSQIYFNGTSGNTYVFYIFAPVAGFSAFGSYTGNNDANGPFVYLGFRPRWVMFKDSSTNGVWMIMDSSRETYNVEQNGLAPSNANPESTYSGYQQVDFLSNGFKIRANNANSYWNNVSGNIYIYAAFAENPFKYSNAR